MNKLEDRAKSIFQTAGAYARAAKCVNSASQGDWTLLIPSQVNAALALELYFKTLYYLEYGEDFKVSGKNSHDFYKLFNKLRNTTRRELLSVFQQLMESRNMQDVLQLEAVSKVAIPRDLKKNLEAWSSIFVKARYIYDNVGKIMSMMFFPEIEQVLLNAIRKRKPEWKS